MTCVDISHAFQGLCKLFPRERLSLAKSLELGMVFELVILSECKFLCLLFLLYFIISQTTL